MCAQFLIKANIKQLKELFGVDFPADYDPFGIIDSHVVPYRPCPVIVEQDGKRILKYMNYSLVPSWSKDPKVKFATHNARIETIAEKPTWKNVFKTKRAIVPLSRFIEPIYINKLAGNMVQFFEQGDAILPAAALYDEWINKQTGEVIESCAIITDEPPEFVATTGHDRCPVFLQPSAFDQWLKPGSADSKTLLALLRDHRQDFNFNVTIDRPLKAGWQKRVGL